MASLSQHMMRKIRNCDTETNYFINFSALFIPGFIILVVAFSALWSCIEGKDDVATSFPNSLYDGYDLKDHKGTSVRVVMLGYA